MNSAFLPFIIGICFTDQILQNPRKIEGSFDDFQSKQNRIQKVDNFFKLTDYKHIFLKVRLNYSKILGNCLVFLQLFTFLNYYETARANLLLEQIHFSKLSKRRNGGSILCHGANFSSFF